MPCTLNNRITLNKTKKPSNNNNNYTPVTAILDEWEKTPREDFVRTHNGTHHQPKNQPLNKEHWIEQNRRTWWSRAKQAWNILLSRLLLINETTWRWWCWWWWWRWWKAKATEARRRRQSAESTRGREMLMVNGGGDGSKSGNDDNVDGFSTATAKQTMNKLLCTYV